MLSSWNFRLFLFGFLLLLRAGAAVAQEKPALGGVGAAPAPKIAVPLAIRPSTADTSRFPLTYCMALPSLTPGQWEQDYKRYERLLAPEIKATQAGLDFVAATGVRTWWCANSASPHAQLDTATRIADPQRLVGEWHSVANRLITHIDSFSLADQRFYRSAVAQDVPGAATLTFTSNTLEMAPASLRKKRANKNFVLLNQRYLLLYGTAKRNGTVSLMGLDSAGRLIINANSVTERSVRGQYLTYQTVVRQLICERGK
ncbi:hypothetical protein [Hymenobacter negativus]|uniref:Uncharacterized protein n=1 Tax=Hymenobacter negativus TaxID=2795026 RepID=A0ABS3Q9R6_9BACT|nr:hypothetical protein [Hymenobacter negativus]MBO2007984.1 hypothetical protein [Hymenobacter negativus]